MKTALCFTGTGRSIEYTFSNLKQNLIDNISNCDVIVYLADNPKAVIAKEYFESLDNTEVYINKEEPVDLEPYRFRAGWPGRKTSSHEIFINMLKSRSYMKTLIDKKNKDYDRVIFSRMDIEFEKPVNKLIADLDISSLWVPNFHDWGGYNDRFAVSSKENMFEYFSLYDNIIDYCKSGHILHAETSLFHHLKNKNIEVKKFKILFRRVASDGSLRESFW